MVSVPSVSSASDTPPRGVTFPTWLVAALLFFGGVMAAASFRPAALVLAETINTIQGVAWNGGSFASFRPVVVASVDSGVNLHDDLGTPSGARLVHGGLGFLEELRDTVVADVTSSNAFSQVTLVGGVGGKRIFCGTIVLANTDPSSAHSFRLLDAGTGKAIGPTYWLPANSSFALDGRGLEHTDLGTSLVFVCDNTASNLVNVSGTFVQTAIGP